MQTEQLYTLVVDGEIANQGLLLEVAKKAVLEWSRVSPDAHVEYRPDISPTRIVDLLPQMSFVETATVIHAASDALRHSCTFARAFADLGCSIKILDDDTEDYGWMKDEIINISEKSELVELIAIAANQLQTLAKN